MPEPEAVFGRAGEASGHTLLGTTGRMLLVPSGALGEEEAAGQLSQGQILPPTDHSLGGMQHIPSLRPPRWLLSDSLTPGS